MLMWVKVGALLVAGLAAGSATPPPCTCPPPEVETVSCVNGVSSFATAACTVQLRQFTVAETLLCTPGEVAISGGFRTLSDHPRILTAAPLVPSGGHATGYEFVWRGHDPSAVKVYITCERL